MSITRVEQEALWHYWRPLTFSGGWNFTPCPFLPSTFQTKESDPCILMFPTRFAFDDGAPQMWISWYPVLTGRCWGFWWEQGMQQMLWWRCIAITIQFMPSYFSSFSFACCIGKRQMGFKSFWWLWIALIRQHGASGLRWPLLSTSLWESSDIFHPALPFLCLMAVLLKARF